MTRVGFLSFGHWQNDHSRRGDVDANRADNDAPRGSTLGPPHLGGVARPWIAGLLLIAAAILGVAGRREWSASALAAAAPWLFLTPLYFGVSIALNFGIGTSIAGLSLIAAILVWKRLAKTASAPSSLSS